MNPTVLLPRTRPLLHSLLELLLLLLVFLLQLLRLLLVLLLHLLLSLFTGVLLRHSLVFLFLFLLEFISLRLLLREHLLLLLLVPLVLLRVACTGKTGTFHRCQVVRMNGRAGSSNIIVRTPLISATIGASIRRPCLFGRHYVAAVEFSGPRRGCDAGPAHID